MNCPTHISPQDLNLDCFVNPDELDPFITNESLPEEVQQYARHKKLAMAARLDGKIPEALAEEATCQKIYDTLPEIWKW